MKKYFAFALVLALILSVAACGNNGGTSSQNIQNTGINLTQIQTGNYSSLQGTWTEVAYAVNAYDGNGAQWETGALAPYADTLSLSSDEIVFNDTAVVIQGNTLTDSAGSHPLLFENSESSLVALLADADAVAINWIVSFYPKGATNDLQPNNDVRIDNTKNLIVIWTSNNGHTAVFAQTETEPTVIDENGKTEKTAGIWRNAYAEFLRHSENYIEDGHYANTFALADLNNSGVPELIIPFFNGVEGGRIFANVYFYNGNISIIGRQIDMYYKLCWLSTDSSHPGIFVEGGRNSTFCCNYWTIKNNEFVCEPLWSYIYNTETNEMDYKELSSKKQLIDEAKKVISSNPNNEIEFFEINEINIQKILHNE